MPAVAEVVGGPVFTTSAAPLMEVVKRIAGATSAAAAAEVVQRRKVTKLLGKILEEAFSLPSLSPRPSITYFNITSP